MNARQKKFCVEYIKCLNKTEAAIKAGYSKNTASQISCDLMKTSEVKQFIDGKLGKFDVTIDRIVEELAAIAFSNTEDIVDNEGFLKPEHDKRPVAGIKQGKYGVEVATYDKMKALETLGRYKKMFTDRIETVDIPFEQYVKQCEDKDEY